ncbi:MAG: ABC transporter ATP-binding protein, partial [Candidatus Limnocylindrales bacterium]
LVQQTFFAVLREAVADGRTTFLSSHVLSEAEKACDRVAIIREGRLVKIGTVDALRDLSHHEVELTFTGPVPLEAFAGLDGVSHLEPAHHRLRMRVAGPIGPVVRAAGQFELVDFTSREPSLEETFLAEYGREASDVRPV